MFKAGLFFVHFMFRHETLLLAAALAMSTCFALGLRAAYKQARPLKLEELNHTKLMGGVGFAARALGVATIITVSGFGLFVIGVSALSQCEFASTIWNKSNKNFDRFYHIFETMDILDELIIRRSLQDSEKRRWRDIRKFVGII